MASPRYASFADEMTKIAGVGKYLKDSIKWGYYGGDPKAPPEENLFWRWSNRIQRVLGPVQVVREALPKEDKAGLGRSRTERLVTGTGGALGSALGSGMALRTAFGQKGGWKGLVASMGGGMLGGTAGHVVTSLPFRAKRQSRLKAVQAAVEREQQGQPK